MDGRFLWPSSGICLVGGTQMMALIYLLAAIGLASVCMVVVLASWVFLQVMTDDNMKPYKPWWWRF